MRKVLAFLTVSLGLTWVVAASAQTAPDSFKDVPKDHWAYAATEALRAKNIVVGYPDQYFRGKRTLTRYEFAVALDRALKSLPTPNEGAAGPAGPVGPPGEPGEIGPAGEKGDPGITPEELENFKKLANEFKDELAGLGNNMAAVNKKLDALSKQVAELKARIDKMPTIYGGAFLGMRTKRSHGAGADYDGRSFVPSSIFADPTLVNDFVLGVKANIEGGATLDAKVITGNAKNTYGSFGSVSNSIKSSSVGTDTYLDTLEIKTPFEAVGRDSSLTLGRFGYNVSHLTLWKPVQDSYLVNPFVDDDMFRIDGAKLNTKIGSLKLEVAAGQTKSVTDSTGAALNNPKAGAAFTSTAGVANPAAAFITGAKPVGQISTGMDVTQLVSVNATLPVSLLKGGYVRASAIDTKGINGPGFNNVLIFGADTKVGLTDRINFNGDYAKTITGIGYNTPNNTYKNSAFNATFDFATGSFSLAAGYRYIDPLFYAPGYWGRIGNWINPTNIQGPTFRLGYEFAPSFGLSVAGDMYSAARNEGAFGGLNSTDDINRVLVGLRWDVAKNFKTTLDWEGVYYSFGAGSALGNTTGKVHPSEQYFTLGTGYNLSSNTQLKLSAQFANFNGNNALSNGGSTKFNFSELSSSVAVKF